MAIKYKNALTYGYGFNITAKGPVDSRTVVESLSDLTSAWGSDAPAYIGMVVAVVENGNLYTLIADDATNADNWKQVGSGAGSITISKFTFTEDEDPKIVEAKKVGQIIYVTKGTNDYPAGPYIVTGIGTVSSLTTDQEIDGIKSEIGAPANGETAATGIYKVIADAEAALRSDITAIPKFKIEVVEELPTEDISDTTVYLVLDKEGAGDLYTEYIYVNGAWENLGKQTVDLSAYSTTAQMNSAIAAAIANFKVKDVDSTPVSGIAVVLDADGKVKASVTKSTLAADLVGAGNEVGDLSGSNIKIGTAITNTSITNTATVAQAVQVLADQIRAVVASGITDISGDDYIKIGGTSTSKSLTLEVANVTAAVATSLVSSDSAIGKDSNNHLQLVWSSL